MWLEAEPAQKTVCVAMDRMVICLCNKNKVQPVPQQQQHLFGLPLGLMFKQQEPVQLVPLLLQRVKHKMSLPLLFARQVKQGPTLGHHVR